MKLTKMVIKAAVLLSLAACHSTPIPIYSFTTLNFPGASSTSASGINHAGQIVGSYFVPASGLPHGFLLSGGIYTAIDFPGAFHTFANGINDAGQIVGRYFPGTATTFHGFLFSGGIYTPIDFPGATGATSASGINDAGQTVGSY